MRCGILHATRRIKRIKLPQHRRVRILSEGFGCSSEINDYKTVRIGLFYRFPSSDSDDDSGDRRERRRLDPVIRTLVFYWRTYSWRVVEDWGMG
ncbi:hypothetical protein D5086_027810 [Populus alba]|uniref:Uncharacterized protein n=1 Tax=Populus alba TaxID=43335 RepID=A0ACC4AX83_POPAL